MSENDVTFPDGPESIEHEKFPHYWTGLDAFASFRTEFIHCEVGRDQRGAGMIGVGFLSGDVTIESGYYVGDTGIGTHAEQDMDMGSLANLSPEQARRVAASLKRAADLAEADRDG